MYSVMKKCTFAMPLTYIIKNEEHKSFPFILVSGKYQSKKGISEANLECRRNICFMFLISNKQRIKQSSCSKWSVSGNSGCANVILKLRKHQLLGCLCTIRIGHGHELHKILSQKHYIKAEFYVIVHVFQVFSVYEKDTFVKMIRKLDLI